MKPIYPNQMSSADSKDPLQVEIHFTSVFENFNLKGHQQVHTIFEEELSVSIDMILTIILGAKLA